MALSCSHFNKLRKAISLIKLLSPFSIYDNWNLSTERLGNVLSSKRVRIPQLVTKQYIHSSFVFYDDDDRRRKAIPEPSMPEVVDRRRLVLKYRKVEKIPWDTSIKYMESLAYKETYGDLPVWDKYVRNFSKQRIPIFSRKACILRGITMTGNPCPICRDDYLVVDYRNVKLIEQFISPHNGLILPTTKTHVCQFAQTHLEIAIRRARNSGLLIYDVPLRVYDYNEYYPPELLQPDYCFEREVDLAAAKHN